MRAKTEVNFIINPILKKGKVSSFAFMFKIPLRGHKDDEGVLIYILNKLGVGNVRIYKDECIFNVTDREGISLLIFFYKYNLNITKFLDYLDLKEAGGLSFLAFAFGFALRKYNHIYIHKAKAKEVKRLVFFVTRRVIKIEDFY